MATAIECGQRTVGSQQTGAFSGASSWRLRQKRGTLNTMGPRTWSVLAFLMALLFASPSTIMQAQTFQAAQPLFFTMPYQGANPLPQVLTVASAGVGFNFYTAVTTSTGGSWLKTSSSNGGNATPFGVAISITPSTNMAPGTYTGTVTFSTASSPVKSMAVPVTLIIEQPSSATFFDNLPGQVSFSMLTKGIAPPAQPLQIRNAGISTLNWTGSVSTSDGGNWLSLSSTSGIAPTTISAAINPANLPYGGQAAGTYTGQVSLQTPGDTVTIPVSVTVGDSVFQQANALNFTMPYQGANPLPQLLTVASTGTDFSFYTNAVNSTGTWLTTSSSNGGNATPFGVTVNVTAAANMAPGTYTDEITFQSSDRTLTMTVPVTLTVEQPGSTVFFDNLPGQLSFSMLAKGAAPFPLPLQVRNAGSGTLPWTGSTSTSDGGAWLSLSSASGTAPSTISVSINPHNLPYGGQAAGTYIGQVLLLTSGKAVTVPVSVVVGPVNGSVFEQPSGLNFTMPYQGANPLPQVLTVASTGTDFSFYTNTVNSTGSWLKTSSSNGGNSTPYGVTVMVTAVPNMAPGTYTDEIIFQSSDRTLSMVVPVTLTIEQPSSATFFDNLPGQLSFSMLTKGTAPPAQPLQIRNAGTGTLNWTGSVSTSDGGKWLSLSSIGGTAPSTISVAVNPANLPYGGQAAGTYIGLVTLQTPGNTVTVPVSVVLGTRVFQQANALSFTMPYQGANSLPQVLTVASTGNDFSFYTNTVNSTGSWLTTSSSNGGNTTPYGVTVNATAAINMAPGTYTNEIIFQSSDRTLSMTIPVTLTIEQPSSSAFFDNLPGQLSFSGKPDGSAPATQAFQIRNAGKGTLAWTLNTSTSDGGAWLTASSYAGMAPSSVTLGVNPAYLPYAGLANGTYTGQVVLQTQGKRVTIPVSVQLGPSVFQQKQPLYFTMRYQGANPLPQTLTVASTGTDFSFYTNTVNSTGTWLKTSSSNGGNSTPYAVTVTVTPATNMPQGIYTDEIIFQSSDRTLAMTVPVTLTVGNGGVTAPVAATPTFTPAAGTYSSSQSVTIADETPGATIYYTVNGSTPTISSTVYTGPIIVTTTETIQAVAVASGYTTSAVASATYTITSTVPSPKAPGFASMAYIATGASTGGVSLQAVAADFNGDGFQDLATTNNVDGTVSVLLGKGNGSFQTPVTYAVGNGPYGIVAGDFNGDGKRDLAVVNGLDDTVSILLNGAGTFPAKPSFTYAVGSQPYGVSAGDFNHDGFTDLAVTNNASKTVSVLLGKGDGSFQPAASYATGSYPFGTVIADVNNDGYVDLIVWNLGDNNVGVLLNNQAGGFLPQTTYATGADPYSVSTGDFNGDGYPDLAVANLGGNTVSVMLNNKAGGFASAVSYKAGLLPASVLAKDLNSDGVLDLTVANLGDGTFSVLLGKGDGTFLAETAYAAGTQPYSLLSADFNGDGLPDLAVTSFFENTLGVLLQNSSSTNGKIKGTPPKKLLPLPTF